jgi:hypothetical protein
LAVLAGCGAGGGSHGAPAIGEAYVGPAQLKIRGDIPLESPTVATVKHGDRLDILGRRRRFFRVRTPGGAEGWTDERQLLNVQEMDDLKDLAERAAKMPAQGQGTTFGGNLNVHTQPNRLAPSFMQIKDKEKVDVLASMVFPRTDLVREPLLPRTPKKVTTLVRKPAREPKYPPPPMPKPPAVTPNWQELSKTNPDPEAAPDAEEAPAEKPIATDDWSLVRTKSGQTGWVLTRQLLMAIPDEVAQYAEGHRIVSYFSLAETVDGDQKKPTWLWTTTGGGTEQYDFDSFRVFVWSLRHHRYETAYIERNLEGYSPVLVREVEYAPGKAGTAPVKYPGFSVCTQKKDGQRYRREFALLGNVVRFAGEQPCEPPAPVLQAKTGGPAAPEGLQPPGQPVPAPAARAENFLGRLRNGARTLTRRWLRR